MRAAQTAALMQTGIWSTPSNTNDLCRSSASTMAKYPPLSTAATSADLWNCRRQFSTAVVEADASRLWNLICLCRGAMIREKTTFSRRQGDIEVRQCSRRVDFTGKHRAEHARRSATRCGGELDECVGLGFPVESIYMGIS